MWVDGSAHTAVNASAPYCAEILNPVTLSPSSPHGESRTTPRSLLTLQESVSYAGIQEPPPGEGFDPFEREVHGPTVILDDRVGKVLAKDSPEDMDVWTCHFR